MKSRTYIVRNELDRARLIADIRRAPLAIKGEPAPILAKLGRHKRKRSLNQNATMWAWNTILALHVGCSPEEMHEDFCREINGTEQRVNSITGEITERVKGTSRFSTSEMSGYMDEMTRISAMHFGVALPPPNSPEAWDAYEMSGMSKRLAA